MSGVLQFALGLNVAQFKGAVDSSMGKISNLTSKLLGMTGVVIATEAAFKAAAAAIDLVKGPEKIIAAGASLELLSKQTGESVANLYELQKGFQGVGLDANSAGSMIYHMQRALGGVNEQGEPTGIIFQQMGLDLAKLKTMGGPEAIQAITSALGRMNKTSAAAAAGKIFGRENAKDALVIARSGAEFAEAIHKAAPMAAFFGRMAEAFHRIEIMAGRVFGKLNPIFAGIAEGLAPAIERVLKLIDKIDLSKIGAGIKHVIDIALEIFKEGRFGELLSDSFEAGVERMGNMIFGILGNGSFWGGIWKIAWGSFDVQMAESLKVLLRIGDILKASIETALDTVWEKIATNFPKLAHLLGVENFKAKSFSEHYAEQKGTTSDAQNMLTEWAKAGGNELMSGIAQVKEAMAAAGKNAGGPAQDKLNALISSIEKAISKLHKSKKPTGSDDDDGDNLGAAYTPDRTALEKMGFVFRGGAGSDPQSQTAKNTRQMVGLLQNISQKLGGGVGGGKGPLGLEYNY